MVKGDFVSLVFESSCRIVDSILHHGNYESCVSGTSFPRMGHELTAWLHAAANGKPLRGLDGG
jgi:hypothetical protein